MPLVNVSTSPAYIASSDEHTGKYLLTLHSFTFIHQGVLAPFSLQTILVWLLPLCIGSDSMNVLINVI